VRMALLGPPGCGKGTQGAVLRERYGSAHVSTGELLRTAVKDGSELGLAAAAMMAEGKLVPDDLVLGLVEEQLNGHGRDNYLLDGFPRTLAQASAFDTASDSGSYELDQVVALDVPESELVRRLCGRRSCVDCGRLYHLEFRPPSREAVCDACEGTLEQRADDVEESVRARLGIYRDQTAPLLGFYGEKGILNRIDGTGNPSEVTARILEALGG